MYLDLLQNKLFFQEQWTECDQTQRFHWHQILSKVVLIHYMPEKKKNIMCLEIKPNK